MLIERRIGNFLIEMDELYYSADDTSEASHDTIEDEIEGETIEIVKSVKHSRNLMEIQQLQMEKLESQLELFEKINYNLQQELGRVLVGYEVLERENLKLKEEILEIFTRNLIHDTTRDLNKEIKEKSKDSVLKGLKVELLGTRKSLVEISKGFNEFRKNSNRNFNDLTLDLQLNKEKLLQELEKKDGKTKEMDEKFMKTLEKVNFLNKEIKEKDMNLKTLEKENMELKKDVARIEKLQIKIGKIEKENTELKIQLSRVIESKDLEIKELKVSQESEMKELRRRDEDKTRGLIEKLQVLSNEVKEKNKTLKDKTSKMETHVGIQEDFIQKYKDQELKLVETVKRNKEFELKIQDLRLQKEKLKEKSIQEIQNLSLKIKEKDGKIQDISNKSLEIQESNKKLLKKVEDLEKKFHGINLEYQKSQSSLKDLEKLEIDFDKNAKDLEKKSLVVVDLENEIKDLKVVVGVLEEKMVEKNSSLTKIQEKLKKSVEKVHIYETNIEELDHKLKKSLEKLHVYERNGEEWENKLKKSIEAGKKYEGSLKELQEKLNVSVATGKKYEDSLKELQDKLNVSVATGKLHEGKIKGLQEKLNTLIESGKIQEKNYTELQEKFKKSVEMEEFFDKKARDLDSQLLEVTAAKENLVKEMNLLNAEVNDLKEKLDIYKRAETMGLRAHEQLEKSSSSYLQHNDELKQSNQNLEREIASLKSNLASSHEEIESLIVREVDLKKSIRKLKIENQNIISKLKSSDTEMEIFKTDYESLRQEICSLKSDISIKDSLLQNKHYEFENLEQNYYLAESELQLILPRYSSLKDKLDFVLTHSSNVEDELVKTKTELNLLKPEKNDDQPLNIQESVSKPEEEKQDETFKETAIAVQEPPIKRKKSNSIFQKLSSLKKSFGSTATLNDSDPELFNEYRRLSTYVNVNDKTPKDIIDAVLNKLSSLNSELQERDDFVRAQTKKLELLERLVI